MNRETAYITSIPAAAREQVTQQHDDGSIREAEYYEGDERVGVRTFYPDGGIEIEKSFRGGVLHGWHYYWYDPGELTSAEPFENGVAHGTAYQWASDGRLIGTYTMDRGTGIDLWWQDWRDGTVELSEVHYYVNGVRHGFEWWLGGDGKIFVERHWQNGIEHGIEREWNAADRLHRGFPRYFVRGERVTKRQYIRAAATDPTLPAFDAQDNAPTRAFPPEVARHLIASLYLPCCGSASNHENT